jgi:hypothetical protein
VCQSGQCACPSTTHCSDGSCCTGPFDEAGNCCCNGTIAWPTTGRVTCNPCPSDETFCYCNDGIGGWTCCENGCNGCTGEGNSGLARCL